MTGQGHICPLSPGRVPAVPIGLLGSVPAKHTVAAQIGATRPGNGFGYSPIVPFGHHLLPLVAPWERPPSPLPKMTHAGQSQLAWNHLTSLSRQQCTRPAILALVRMCFMAHAQHHRADTSSLYWPKGVGWDCFVT